MATETKPTGSAKHRAMEETLLSVIKTLQDSQKGFADIGEHLQDDTLKRFFLAESLRRATFRAELENELHRQGMADVHESGSAAAVAHRIWGDLKAKLGGGDLTLLETSEQGEDEAKKTYQQALDQPDLAQPVREMLTAQQAHVNISHDYVKRARDQRKK